jgi:hypothetical protein
VGLAASGACCRNRYWRSGKTLAGSGWEQIEMAGWNYFGPGETCRSFTNPLS